MKKLSTYGTQVLDELEVDRGKFRKGNIEVENARAIAQMANATSRVLKETLNCKKFESPKK